MGHLTSTVPCCYRNWLSTCSSHWKCWSRSNKGVCVCVCVCVCVRVIIASPPPVCWQVHIIPGAALSRSTAIPRPDPGGAQWLWSNSLQVLQCQQITSEGVIVIVQIVRINMKTAILSWLQNDGFSKDQLKGKQLLPTFRPDALVVFRAKMSARVVFL